MVCLGDAITGMLGTVQDIAGHAEQAFVAGQGLSQEGVRLLGRKLACMTIGDLEAMLDTRNVDPFEVAQLMKDLMDLAKALVCTPHISVNIFGLQEFKEDSWALICATHTCMKFWVGLDFGGQRQVRSGGIV